MNQEVVNEILDELISAFESIETQSAGILMYLKAQEIVTDAQLKPYLEEAANASSVRWRAARARVEHLLSGALKDADSPDKAQSQSGLDRDSQPKDHHQNQPVPHAQKEANQPAETPTERAAETEPTHGSSSENHPGTNKSAA